MKGQCIYNAKWERDPCYREWIGPFKGDKKKVLCRLCDRIIDISSMGESALKSHAKSAKHTSNLRLKQGSTLSDFGFGSVATSSTRNEGQVGVVTAKSTSEAELTVPLPPADAEVRKDPGSIKSFLTKDDVLRAEILWVLKLITSHYSFTSSKEMSELLPKMFPDSEIAKQFQCGERKSSYMCIFGLAEHFSKQLKESIKGPFVVLFDESLNKKMQKKQMDIHVRFIVEGTFEVRTRYFGSTFLGSSNPAPGSYNIANDNTKGAPIKFARSSRFADLKENLPGPCDTSSFLDISTSSISSWNGCSAMSTPHKKVHKIKFENSKLEATIAILEKEIKDLKLQNAVLHKEMPINIAKEDKSVWTEEYAISAKECDKRTQGVNTVMDVEEKAVGTDPSCDVADLLENKETEIANLHLLLRCEKENSKADLELEQSRNAALRMRMEALEKINKELSLDRDHAEDENRKLHGVAAELRADNLQLLEGLKEKDDQLQHAQGRLNHVTEEGQKKVDSLEAAVSEQMMKVRSQEETLKQALKTCEANFSEAQGRAETLLAKNSELQKRVNEMEENLVEVILREQKAVENVRCMEGEKCSLECQLTQSHNDYEQRLALSSGQIESLQAEIKRNEEMMTNNLRSLTAKYEALEHSYATEKSSYEHERQTLTANIAATEQSLQESKGHEADLEFICVSIKEQLLDEQQITAELQGVCQDLVEKLHSSQSRVTFLEEESLQIQEAAQEDRVTMETRQNEIQQRIVDLEMRERELLAELDKSVSMQKQQDEQLTDTLDNLERLKSENESAAIKFQAEAERYKKEATSLQERVKEIEETLGRKASQAEEKATKIKEEFGRRLVETQKKLNQSEMNYTRYQEEQTMKCKMMDEELARYERLHSEQLGQLDVEHNRRLDVEREHAALQEKLNRQSGNEAVTDLKAQIEMWQSKYEELEQRIEPFKEQLDAYEAEKNALLSRNSEALNEVSTLGAQYAKLLGHQNNKQKIHHVLKLKQENLSLKAENAKLREQCDKQKRSQKRLEEKADSACPGKKRFNPSEAFSHAKKENRPLSVVDGNVNTRK